MLLSEWGTVAFQKVLICTNMYILGINMYLQGTNVHPLGVKTYRSEPFEKVLPVTTFVPIFFFLRVYTFYHCAKSLFCIKF